jgi:two-component sensor histidine kinase
MQLGRLELGLELRGLEPFPSIADFFYLLFYPLMWLGLVIYPNDEVQPGDRKFLHLDNLIVIIGSGLSIWTLLIAPTVNSDEPDLLRYGLGVLYPVTGMVLLWGILTFFRNRLQQSVNIPILLIGMGIVGEITSDTLFAIAIDSYTSGSWIDLGWVTGSMMIGLAAILQVQRLSEQQIEDREARINHWLRYVRLWPIYLPYLWVGLAYAILVVSLPIDSENLYLVLGIGIIIALVIFRQVLTIISNEQLINKAQHELQERIQAQAALHQANITLDQRVQERTEELRNANLRLSEINTALEASVREKEVLLKEIHHRVKNNLQVISSLLNLQIQIIHDPAARSALLDSQMRVHSMALIHEKLHESDDRSRILLSPYIKSLSANLLHSYRKDNATINLVTRVEDIATEIDKAIPIGLILNELISNSLKHAFPENRSGEIGIELHREAASLVLLRYYDTGVGLPVGFDIHTSKSLGMRLVHSLAKQLNAELELENHAGIQLTLNIPIKSNDIIASAQETI